jgi:hypothetical protein
MEHIYGGSVIKQFERAQRFQKRIHNQDRDSTEYDDDLLSFFMHCHHLKDWVEKDLNADTTKQEVKDLIANNIELQICADLANRSKHVVFKIAPWQDAKITGRSVTIDLGRGASTSEHIIMLKDGSKYSALDVADKAVDIWSQFLQSKNLIH